MSSNSTDNKSSTSEQPATACEKPIAVGEISKEETDLSDEGLLRAVAADLDEFAAWAGFDPDQKVVCHILLAGTVVKDPIKLSETVGAPLGLVDAVLARIKANRIYAGFSWFDDVTGSNVTGSMSLLLDTLVAAGDLERVTIDGEIAYQEVPPCIGDRVVHKSGRGSGWWVSKLKREPDGKTKLQLVKSRARPGPGGKWHDATDYRVKR